MLFKKQFNFYFEQLKDPLYTNSLYLMLTSLSAAAFGFVFWIVAAKLYLPADVGLATVLISSMSLLVAISRLGLDQSLIRYFPNGDKNKIFFSSLLITSVAVLILGIIFIIGLEIWAPELTILYQITPIFLLFLLCSSIFSLTGFAFVALRRANYYFFQNLFVGIRILFLFPFVALGAIGIFFSVGLTFFLALSVPSIIFWRFKIRLSGIDITFLKDSFNFSVGNYLIGLFSILPNFLLPIIVFNTLGNEQVAYFYLSFSLASLILIIPTSLSTSVFVEGSHGIQVNQLAKKSFSIALLLMIPLIVIMMISGDFILGLIGTTYKEGLNLLRIMAISSIPFTLFQIFCSIKKVQKDIYDLILLNFFNLVMILILSYWFILLFGITGVGYAWLISYGIIDIIVIYKWYYPTISGCSRKLIKF